MHIRVRFACVYVCVRVCPCVVNNIFGLYHFDECMMQYYTPAMIKIVGLVSEKKIVIFN